MHSITRFGLLYGLALGIGFYGSHLVLGSHPDNFNVGEIVGYSVMIISSLAILLGIKEYKQKRLPNTTSYVQALGVGIGISLIASSIFAVYNWIYLEFINPEFTATYVQYTEEQIRTSRLPEEEIKKQLAELAHYADLMSNNFAQAMVMFATVFLIGLLFSLIGSINLPKLNPR